MRELKPFDQDSPCVKCGCASAESEHALIYVARPSVLGSAMPEHEEVEFISRRCCRCKFVWREACLDAEKPKPCAT